MAKAISQTLSNPPDAAILKNRANDFSLEKALAQYGKLL
jgi:hypothetical protein